MSKIVKYGNEVNKKFLDGMTQIANVVGSTMGARGRTVAINERGSVHLSKDGVTVARNFELSDPIESMGASLIREASGKTNSECGDGSTGVCILLHDIYKNGLKYTSLGANPVLVKNGIMKASENVIEYLNSISKPISTKDEIKNVALVSSNGDEEIAEVISDIFSKIGKNGTIKVEEGKTMKMESRIVEGCVIDSGYASPYFVTNEKMECNMDNAFVMVTDKKLSNVNDMIPVLEAVSKTGRPILLIAEDIEGDCLSTLVLNRLRGGLTVCAIKAPGYGEIRTENLNDICALTGAKLVSDNTGISFQDAVNCLGQCKNITVTKNSTTFIGGVNDKEEFNKYVETLRTNLENETNEFFQKKIRERLGRLTDGIGIIGCGAATEAELKEKRDRVDDSFNSAKNALKMGIVPGGGIALLEAGLNLEKTLMLEDMETDEKIGVEIIHDSLLAPITKIVNNAGECAELIIQKIRENPNNVENFGYDVKTKTYQNMIESGIIDPTSVIVSQIKNSSSIAGTLLTTDSCIVDVPDDDDKKCGCNHNGRQMNMPMM